MNSLVTLSCLLAAVGLSHGSALGYGLGDYGLGGYGLGYGLGKYGYGGYGLGYSSVVVPAAISSANQWKAAPIPVIKTIAAPIISAPIIKTVAPLDYGYGYGLGGYYGGLGYKSLGYGYGNGYGYGKGYGYGYGH
ncbi:hypothetical protein JYU34_017743 [Plutella xylostella]|uniref:Uncharacterized protein n=2 Tax=Plutella xylostella TaxID=51655 RepID=A0ABQ7Q217_PLUXY|nr:shematrin-like protein 1 [Plutella xylostella]KAG7299195.1 hypothetical protein JYU34_017743 [Plutella xylostella]CAG9137265.1 unnamed protein product [Plutella xylostella]